MVNDIATLPIGKQVSLPGHFDVPVVLEEARLLGKGFECQVRLPDGSLDAALITQEEAVALGGTTPVADLTSALPEQSHLDKVPHFRTPPPLEDSPPWKGTRRYMADITAGSLKVPESRIIADLLLHEIDEAAWKEATVKEDILKARNPATAIRLARLIWQRLETMKPDLWQMIRDGTVVVATHAVLAADDEGAHTRATVAIFDGQRRDQAGGVRLVAGVFGRHGDEVRARLEQGRDVHDVGALEIVSRPRALPVNPALERVVRGHHESGRFNAGAGIRIHDAAEVASPHRSGGGGIAFLVPNPFRRTEPTRGVWREVSILFQFTAIPQEFGKNAGRFGLALPHGRDEK